jgi:hypothetical protein
MGDSLDCWAVEIAVDETQRQVSPVARGNASGRDSKPTFEQGG